LSRPSERALRTRPRKIGDAIVIDGVRDGFGVDAIFYHYNLSVTL